VIGEEPEEVRRLIDRIVVIDSHPVGTTDFDLTPDDKTLLLAAGRVAAMHFLAKNIPDEAPTASELETATEDLNERRLAIGRRRG
jgi:hypothetical protein